MTIEETPAMPRRAHALLERRAVAFGAVWLPAMAAAQMLRAQTGSLEAVAASAEADGRELLAEAANAPRGAELSREGIARIVSLDLMSRERAFDAFDVFSEPELRDYAQARSDSVAAQFEGLPITPQSRAQIVPMIVPPPRPPSAEPLAVVLVDIVFQSLGIYLGDELIRSILGTDPEFEAAFAGAIDALSTEDPD